jgi:CBS domain-containing protein
MPTGRSALGSPELLYVSRLVGLALLDAEGVTIGRIDDVVLGPATGDEPPQVLAFVASVQRRRIFVNAGRVGEIDTSGVRLRSGTIDLRRFELRHGEMLAREHLFDTVVDGEQVVDVGLVARSERRSSWEVATVALGGGRLRRRARRVIPWREAGTLFDADPVASQVAALRRLHPSEIANALRQGSAEERSALAEALDVEELADVMEELPEAEQVDILESLDLDRAADVLEEMEPDDAADLLGELPEAEQSRLLEAMEPEEADPLRRLLVYAEDTAGGLMTPEPVIVTPDTPVATVLARLRDPVLAPALAAQVFVTRRPTATPTGRLLGVVGFQRLLREAPGLEVGRCVEEGWDYSIDPGRPTIDVAEKLAQYDLLALPVCDEDGRLLGAVTVDDVLDRTLPPGWRR